MEENMRSLERKLNQIIDDELKKNIPQIDTELIMACCDGLLRTLHCHGIGSERLNCNYLQKT